MTKNLHPHGFGQEHVNHHPARRTRNKSYPYRIGVATDPTTRAKAKPAPTHKGSISRTATTNFAHSGIAGVFGEEAEQTILISCPTPPEAEGYIKLLCVAVLDGGGDGSSLFGSGVDARKTGDGSSIRVNLAEPGERVWLGGYICLCLGHGVLVPTADGQ